MGYTAVRRKSAIDHATGKLCGVHVKVFDRNMIFSLSADNDIDRNERADTKVWPKAGVRRLLFKLGCDSLY